MIDFYFENYELIHQVFTHFFNHYIFYFFLILNFFIIRFFKYSIDNNNNIVRNFKHFENKRTLIDCSRLNLQLEIFRLYYYAFFKNRNEVCSIKIHLKVFKI